MHEIEKTGPKCNDGLPKYLYQSLVGHSASSFENLWLGRLGITLIGEPSIF